MESVFEILSLFFLISNNFTSQFFPADLRRYLKSNRIAINMLVLGLLFNSIMKHSPYDYNTRFGELVAVFMTVYLLTLQTPVMVVTDVCLMSFFATINVFVRQNLRRKFRNCVAVFMFVLIVIGLVHRILSLKARGLFSPYDFFILRHTTPAPAKRVDAGGIYHRL